MQSGPEALAFRDTLFRISEIAWLKAARLTRGEKIARGVLVVLGLVFVWAVANAKGSYVNVECLLALFPLHAAILMRGQTRLASTGDFEESYDDRGDGRDDVFRSWIVAIKENNPDYLAVQSDDYHYLLNPARLAWARPTWETRYYPVFLAILFAAYAWVLRQGYDVTRTPILSDVRFLYFEPGGLGLLSVVCWLLVAVSVFAFVVSFKRSIEVTAAGGVHDTFWLNAKDQQMMLDIVSGRRRAAEQPPEKAQSSKAARARQPEKNLLVEPKSGPENKLLVEPKSAPPERKLPPDAKSAPGPSAKETAPAVEEPAPS
ncbi:MAG: hypothetical protein HY319_16430 [Armatimonadetes bacterium]|nr:hypothetical protein [Armatimonadota bacterium]